MILDIHQEDRLINAARLARDGRRVCLNANESLLVDQFQSIMDELLSIVKIPGQEMLK